MDQTSLVAADGTTIATYSWLPEGDPVAVVQIAHGMAEHAQRYDRFARALTDAGYAVYANDHRGHGATAGDRERLGHFADADGWRLVVSDMVALTDRIESEHPGLPVFLLGHSMGSMLSRSYVIEHGDRVAGLVLSGTGGDPGLLGKVGGVIAALEARVRGKRHRSRLLDKMTFGAFNGNFKPNRTSFDWLSRDHAEVDKYVADPLCGNLHSATFWVDMLGGLASINDATNVRRIRKDLPILLVSGERDPVGGKAADGVRAVAAQFRAAGVTDVREIFYSEARHEILNETNRDQVTADIVAWLDAHR